MNSPGGADDRGDVKAYMGSSMGLIVTAAYNALAAFLRALGDSNLRFISWDHSAAINVVLTWYLSSSWNGVRLRLCYSYRSGGFSSMLHGLHYKEVSDPSSGKEKNFALRRGACRF